MARPHVVDGHSRVWFRTCEVSDVQRSQGSIGMNLGLRGEGLEGYKPVSHEHEAGINYLKEQIIEGRQRGWEGPNTWISVFTFTFVYRCEHLLL